MPDISTSVRKQVSSFQYRWLYLLLTLLCFFMWYVSDIGGGIWLDHVMYARSAWSIIHGNPYTNPTHMFAPAAKYLIVIGQVVFGPTPVGSRLPIVLTGILTIFLTYLLGSEVFNMDVGLAASVTVGMTPLFASHAVMVMLDVPLTLFVTMLVIVIIKFDDQPTFVGILGGAFAILVAASKSYGVLFIVGPLLILSSKIVIWETLKIKRYLKSFGFGAGCMIGLLYTPVALVPNPNYFGGVTPPAIAESIFSLPLLGNIAYAFAVSLYHNLTAHSTTAGTSLFDPFIWVVSYGGVAYGLGIVFAGLFAIRRIKNRQFDDRTYLSCTIIITVLILTLLPKSYPRYLLPIFPACAVFGIGTVCEFIEQNTPNLTSKGTKRTVAMVILIITSAATIAPLYLNGTQIHTDSGYDEIATELEQQAVNTNDSIVVVSEQPHVLNWHLGDKYDEAYYDDPTAPHRNTVKDGGEVVVIGVDRIHANSVPRARKWINEGNVTYIVNDTNRVTAFDMNQISVHTCTRERVDGYTGTERYKVSLKRVCPDKANSTTRIHAK